MCGSCFSYGSPEHSDMFHEMNDNIILIALPVLLNATY